MQKLSPKKIIIIGATSGIGRELALQYIKRGNFVGVTGRREILLRELQHQFPYNIFMECFDVRKDDNIFHIDSLIEKMGGVDIFIYCAGYGDISKTLNWEIDKPTYEINVKGFVELANYMFNYFVQKGGGQIAAISSVAANRGNSLAPAYSASKAFISNYMEGLYMKTKKLKAAVYLTDLQLGFVKTKKSREHPHFWEAPVDKAAKQIMIAIEKKKWRVYVTKRWWLVAKLMKCTPAWIYHKVG